MVIYAIYQTAKQCRRFGCLLQKFIAIEYAAHLTRCIFCQDESVVEAVGPLKGQCSDALFADVLYQFLSICDRLRPSFCRGSLLGIEVVSVVDSSNGQFCARRFEKISIYLRPGIVMSQYKLAIPRK